MISFAFIFLITANVIVAIDVILYILMSPEISWRFLLIFMPLFILINASLFFIQRKKMFFKIILLTQWGLIILYTIGVFFLSHVVNNLEYSIWYEALVKLDLVKEELVLYHKNNHKFPATLRSINVKLIEDPYQVGNHFIYRRLNADRCLVYSVGPDGVDDKGSRILKAKAIEFSSNVMPWNLMPFGTYMLRISGFDEKLRGDIVRVIRVRSNNYDRANENQKDLK